SFDAQPAGYGGAPADTAEVETDPSFDDYVVDDEPPADTAAGDRIDKLEPADSVEDILADAGDVDGTHHAVKDPGRVEDAGAGLFEEIHDEMAPGDETTAGEEWDVERERLESHEESTARDAADGSAADEPSGWESEEWGPAPPRPGESRTGPNGPDGPDEPIEPSRAIHPTEPVETPDDHWDEEPAGDEVFVDLSRDSRRVDVNSAVDDDRLFEDDNLRDLGWSQYGQRLRKIVNRERARKPKRADDDDES
ncbi:MAG: hypothetical protein P8181_15580, partial [bacterium]